MNNFILQFVAGLSKTKSKQQIKSDAKSLGDMYVKLIGNLDMPKTRKAIKAQLKGLNNLIYNITPNANTKGVQTATKQAINNAQRVANSNKVHLNFDTSKQQLVNQIKILGRNNNKLFNNHEMTAKYNQLLNAANVAKSTGELKTLRGELSAFKTELVATNNAGMTWGSKFKESIKSYAKFFSGASMIYALSNQVRNAATEAKTLDDSLVNLQKVTDEIADRDALYKYFDKSLSKAQELNVKVGSLIDAVTEFKKLGWDLDDAELGAEWANVLANVGDVDIETAIGSIKTSIASFDEIGGYGNDQMDKKLEAYTNLINNMSNKYSIDAEGLAESIRLSAGTLTEAHMSIEQAATMFATANKYYNDPSYLGNTAKIGSLRMRASSGDTDAIEELQEMGEEVDDLATATSNLREKLMALTGVDIMEDEHTFKSYYDQLYEISQVMDKLDDTSRANVLETMFGKSRSAAGAAILSGMKESASAYEDAINSAGSATEEYQTWMTSADAACQRFSNTLTETYQSIINGNTVRDLANLGSAVLEFANNWGIVEGTLKGVIALGIGKFLTTGTMALITATKQVEQYGKALQMASNVPNGNLSARFQALKSIAQVTSTLTTEQLRNVLATNTLTQADRVRILQMQGMTKEMALQKLAEMNLTQSTNAQTAANTASTASTFSLKAAMTGLGATIKSVFLSNPVGIVLMGISLGVSAVTSAVSKHNRAVEEARQKTKDAAGNANTLSTEISELANKYIQLSEAVKTDSASKEDLMSVQEELIKKLGIEGQSVDDLIAKYGSLDNALKNITLQELGDQENDLIAGVKAAEEELKDIGKGYEHWYSSTNRNFLSSGGDDAVKAYEVLEKANLIDKGSYGTGGGAFVLTGDDETVDGILENYQKLQDAMTALRESGQFTETELAKNPVFSQIYDRAKEMEEFVNGYNDAISNLNKNVAEQLTITLLQGNEIPKTEEEFETFRQELIDTSVASKKFIGNEKEIADAINNYLSTVPQFQGFYSIPLENELDKVDEVLNQKKTSKISDIFSLKDANDTLTTLGKISESIDTIQKAFSTLNSAIDEYNNSGSISIDTLQSIIALGDNWYDYLLDENGALKLDKESLQKLTASRLADMKAQIQQNMIDNVKNITDDASAKEYLTSTNYKTADSIEAVTEAMIDQALAEKKLLVDSGDLSQENYDLIEKKLRGDIEKNNLLFSKISLDDVSLGGGSGSGSGSGSSSSKSSNTKIDFIEYRLKELEELANKVQSSIDEAVNASDKNALLGQMQTVDNAKIDTYNKAISYYQKEASSYLEKIPAELREAAKNGAIAITEFIGDNSSEIVDYIQQYRDLDNSIAEATEQVSSLRQEVIKLEKEKFDNIVNAFDSIGNIISSNKSIIESQITYLETSGERIGKGYYESLKDQSNLYLEQLYKERDVLSNQLSTAMSNGVKYGSDEWKDMYSSIQNVDQAIIDTKNDIEGYNNSLRELDWTVFDDVIESIDTISNKLSNLLDLLKTEKVSGDFSGYSKDAITSMSSNAQKMQTANYVIEKTNKEIANLKASYDKGELSVSEYTERLESLENTLWDNISTYNSAKEAIVEIAKARINEEVEAIEKVTEANNERISKLKEELQAEKDLQSYKRSLLEKQNDVSKLQAQINARMGSTDAETIAEREKLEQELADKLKEIKEMQEDQAYDDMMDSLDKEQTAFEEAQQKKIDTLNDSLDDTETLYNNMLNVIFNNTSVTYNRLNELSRQYGFTLEQNITSPWSKGSISSNTFRDTVYRNLNGVSDKFTQLQAKADSISFSKLNSQLGSLNLSTLSTMVSLLSSQINVSGITTGIGNIKSAIENLSKTFETSTKKADNAIKKYGELDKAKKGNNYWVFKTLASYGSHDLARSHLSDYSSHGDISVIEYGGKSLIVKWLKGFPTSGQASYNIGMCNGSGYYQRYKRGGEITENQNLDVIARSMGEDHIATIAYKEGERILTPEQNKAFLKMVDFSDLIAKSNIIKPFLPSNLSPIATPSLQIGTLLNVEGSIDKNSLPDVQKMLDKSKAEIFNEFGQMLKNKNGCRPR